MCQRSKSRPRKNISYKCNFNSAVETVLLRWEVRVGVCLVRATLTTMMTDREFRKRRLTMYFTYEVVTGIEELARHNERPVSEMTQLVLRWYQRDQARWQDAQCQRI